MENEYRRFYTDEQFVNWLYEKYRSVWCEPEFQTDKSVEWYDNEHKEFKKYHPSAGVFVKNLTTDEFMQWINKLKNKS